LVFRLSKNVQINVRAFGIKSHYEKNLKKWCVNPRFKSLKKTSLGVARDFLNVKRKKGKGSIAGPVQERSSREWRKSSPNKSDGNKRNGTESNGKGNGNKSAFYHFFFLQVHLKRYFGS